jgi:hypothetical protein
MEAMAALRAALHARGWSSSSERRHTPPSLLAASTTATSRGVITTFPAGAQMDSEGPNFSEGDRVVTVVASLGDKALAIPACDAGTCFEVVQQHASGWVEVHTEGFLWHAWLAPAAADLRRVSAPAFDKRRIMAALAESSPGSQRSQVGRGQEMPRSCTCLPRPHRVLMACGAKGVEHTLGIVRTPFLCELAFPRRRLQSLLGGHPATGPAHPHLLQLPVIL